jgi:CRP-like cAMP-binding protein
LGFTKHDWLKGESSMPARQESDALIENQLLAALSSKSYKHLAPLLEPSLFALGEILYHPQGIMPYVYFPHQSIISMVNILKNDVRVELAIIGSEGMLGTALLSGDDTSPHLAIVQIADGGMRMKTAAFLKELKQNTELRNLVMRYSQVLFAEVAQTAACNTLHPIVERLARWLLMSQDRIKSDTVKLTHDFIAGMLGVQRAGVTIAAGTLQKAGIIEYHRGKVTILKRQELEEAACECYASLKEEAARLLGKYKNN